MGNCKISFTLLLLWVLVFSVKGREWTNTKGQTIEAEMLKYDQGYVHLKRSDNKVFKLHISNLSEKDIKFIKSEIIKMRRAKGFKGHELFPIQVDGKFGYINSDGLTIIEPKYDYCEHFSEGLAYVTLEGKSGFINSKEEIIINFRKFSKIPHILPFPKEEARMFSSGLLPVKGENNMCGYINQKGEWAIEPEYLTATPFCEGFAVVERFAPGHKGRKGFPIFEIINTEGKKIIDEQFRSIGRFSGGIIPVQPREEGSVYGVLNSEGKWIVKPKYNHIFTFKSGYARVLGENSNFYLDSTGREIFLKIKPKTNQTVSFEFSVSGEDFSGGVLVTSLQEGYYFISGKTLSVTAGPFDFHKINHFSEDLASFQEVKNGSFGFIDLNGKVVIKPRFKKVKDFKNGLALVQDEKFRMYIDKKGRVIWQAKLSK